MFGIQKGLAETTVSTSTDGLAVWLETSVPTTVGLNPGGAFNVLIT